MVYNKVIHPALHREILDQEHFSIYSFGTNTTILNY